MGRYEVKNPLTPEGRNQINSMFEELYKEYTGAGINAKDAREKAVQAVADSILAKDIAEKTRQEMLAIIREQTKNGDLAPEIAQARGKANTLGDRLNSVDSQLAQNDDYRRYESAISRKPTRRPTITIVDDDGRVEVYTILFKLAKEFNIPITSSMITGYVDFPNFPRDFNYGGFYTYEQIKEMRDSGLIEFIFHSHANLSYRNSTDQEIRKDIEKGQAILRAYNLNHRAIAVPFGHYDERVLGIIKDYFDYATGSATSIDETKRIVRPPHVNNYRLGRLSGDGNREFSTIEAGMDEAIATNGGLVLTTHVMQNNGSDEAHFRRIITTALAKGLEFVTLEDCWKIHGNIAQFGGTNMRPANMISSAGMFGDQIGRVKFDHSVEIDGNTPIEYFEKDTVTHTRVSGGREGFPTSGMLETHRFDHADSDLWNYQKFTTTREKLIYIRYWNTETKEWSELQPINLITLPEFNNFSFSDSLDVFPLGETYSIITSDHPEIGLSPNGEEGDLITHKVISGRQRRYNWQEYRTISGRLFERRAIDGSTWTNFEPKDKVTLASENSFNLNTPHSDFPLGETHSIVTSLSDGFENAPDGQRGKLVTNKSNHTSQRSYDFQLYHTLDNNGLYRRFAIDGNTWGEFTKLF